MIILIGKVWNIIRYAIRIPQTNEGIFVASEPPPMYAKIQHHGTKPSSMIIRWLLDDDDDDDNDIDDDDDITSEWPKIKRYPINFTRF